MTLKQCGGMSIELRRGSGNSSESTARSKKEAGMDTICFLRLILHYIGRSISLPERM
jgi:hypothetical protein